MALQKQPITIPILGLDTHVDLKTAQPGTLTVADNVWYRRTAAGGVETQKRFGVTARSKNIQGGGTVSVGRKLATFNDEQLLVSDKQLYSWDSVTGDWTPKGALTPAGLSTVAVASAISGNRPAEPDAAVGGGYLCYAARLGTGNNALRISVINLATGELVLNQASTGIVAGTGTAHVVALSTMFMVIVIVPSAGTIAAIKIDYASPSTVSAPTTVATNASTVGQSWDVARAGTADQVMIFYNGDAANRFRGILWNANMTSAGSFLAGEQPDRSIGVLHHDYLDGHAYVAYVDSTRGTKVLDVVISGFTVNAATVLDAARTTGREITGYRSGGANTVLVEVAGASTYLNKIMRSTGGAFANWQLGMGLRSRVFKVASSYYVGTAYADGLQDKYFVLRADDATSPPQIVATALDGNGSGLASTDSHLTSVPAISSTVVAFPAEKFAASVGGHISGGFINTYGSVYFRIDWSPVLSPPKQLGKNLLLPGAIVRMYDGAVTTELGFPVFPVVSNGVQAAGAAPGTYQFVATYVYIDAQDQLHRSAPSVPYQLVVTGGNAPSSVDVSNLRLGDKGTKAWIELSATGAAGTVYYGRVAQAPGGGDVTTIALFDPLDSTTQGAPLYTTGGVLAHEAPPPANVIEVWRDRAFLTETDNPNDLWASAAHEDGAGAAFSSVTVLSLPSDDAAPSALLEFDDRLLIGKPGALYYLSGNGPALNGAGNYEQPARFNSLAGPTSQLGLTKTHSGVIFKSARGWYFLPRGGADPIRLLPVEGFDSLTVQGASAVAGYEQTRIVTAEGRTLVCHYGIPDAQGLGRWSCFTGQTAVDCANFGGQWCYLQSDGTVQVETVGQYNDNGAAIAQTETFAWLNGGGIFSNLRLYALEYLGEVTGNCTVTGSLAYDYDPTVVDTLTKAVTTATIGVLELRNSRGRVEAVQLTLSESSTTAGYRLSAVGLEIGAKPGFSKQAAGAFLT